MFISRRRRQFRAPRAPNLQYAIPYALDYAAFLVTYYFGTTSTQIWQSTDGVTYTNVGTAGLSSGDQFFTVGGLTRNQKYYFKFKAVGPGGISGFSNVHYMWDVDTIGISYATALATDFGLAGYEIEEYNRVDLLWQTIQGYGLDTGLYQLYLFSPSAGATISMYDIISASYMTQNGGTISGSGVDFNYDGYLDTNAVPGGGASIGTGKSWMINVATHNTFNNIVPGAATYAAIAGAYDGTNRIEIGVYNTGATGILYGQEGLVTNAASVSIGSDASGLGTFNTFGAAFDISAPDNMFISQTPGSTTAGTAQGNPSASQSMFIGGSNNQGNYERLGHFGIHWYSTSTASLYSDLLNMYYSEQQFNSFYGRS